MSHAKTLQLENINQKESLADNEEIPKPSKDIKRPPVQSG